MVAKQSFASKVVPKQELGNQKIGRPVAAINRRAWHALCLILTANCSLLTE